MKTHAKMKTKLAALILLLSHLAFGQIADPHDAFSSLKKSITLSTGIHLKYIDAGPRNGTPVILLHGYTDSGRSFQQVVDALSASEPGFRLIVPDQRGHGASSMPDSAQCAAAPETCFSMGDFATDIIALMDSLRISKAHIVGHSMSSMIAQELVLRHAGRVNSLVLIGAFVNGKDAPAIHDFLIGEMLEKQWRSILEQRPGFRWPADAWSLTPRDLGPEVLDFLKQNWVVDPAADEAFIQAVYPETVNTPLGLWIGVIKALGQMDNRERIVNVKKPTLVLWATQDNFFPEEPDQQWVKEAFDLAAATNGNRVIYKTYGKAPLPASGMQESDLGHNLHWGAPAAVAADIASFIKTGMPVNDLPYADPSNVKTVLSSEAANNITVRGKNTLSEK